MTTGHGQWGEADFLQQAEEGRYGWERGPESDKAGSIPGQHHFGSKSSCLQASPQDVGCVCAPFPSSPRMLSRGYLILIFLWDVWAERVLNFLSDTVPARQGGRHSFALSLEPTWKGTVSGSVATLPAEALCIHHSDTGVSPPGSPAELPGPCRGFPAFPFIVSAPAAQFLPPCISRGDRPRQMLIP